jgi:hypothetical protein
VSQTQQELSKTVAAAAITGFGLQLLRQVRLSVTVAGGTTVTKQ